jgi:hypothetical protein
MEAAAKSGRKPGMTESLGAAKTRFLAACLFSARRCRLDTFAKTHSSEQIDRISAYVEQANGARSDAS